MGVLQRFERRLEGLVEGAFARAFKGKVEPVEIATALEREAGDKAAIVSAGRTLVPNDFVVELSTEDFGRIGPYADPLGKELAEMMRESAAEHQWSFSGPVHITFEEVTDLDTGVFRVRSGVSEGAQLEGGLQWTGGVEEPGDPLAAQKLQAAAYGGGVLPGSPRLALVSGGTAEEGTVEARGGERALLLTKPVTLIGRGHDADIRLSDPGVSRLHVRLEAHDDEVWLTDLGSTNGTTLDGYPVTGPTTLAAGQRITIGSTAFIFLRDSDGSPH